MEQERQLWSLARPDSLLWKRLDLQYCAGRISEIADLWSATAIPPVTIFGGSGVRTPPPMVSERILGEKSGGPRTVAYWWFMSKSFETAVVPEPPLQNGIVLR